jgi:hypothetical protein
MKHNHECFVIHVFVCAIEGELQSTIVRALSITHMTLVNQSNQSTRDGRFVTIRLLSESSCLRQVQSNIPQMTAGETPTSR